MNLQAQNSNGTLHGNGRRELSRLFLGLIGFGGLGIGVGAFAGPERLWANLLIVAYLGLGIGLGALLFLALHYVTGAKWSDPLRRLAEAVASVLPYSALALGAVVAAGLSHYPWMHEDLTAHATWWFKAAWLQPSFFLLRTAAYLILWILFSAVMVRASQREDFNGGGARRWNVRLSALFLAVFSVTLWLATTDWIMSLEPEWYSTIFAVYHFSGILLSGLALITLLAVWLRRSGALDGIVDDSHFHDLGKLLFGFSSFWMYLWYCQYMLIWYANIPEETAYYVRRMQGAWQPLFVLNICLNWAVPFLVLLPRAAKRSGGVLVKVAVVLLIGRWLDLYLSVMPAIAPEAPVPGLAELGAALAAAGVLGLLLLQALQKAPAPAEASASEPVGVPQHG